MTSSLERFLLRQTDVLTRDCSDADGVVCADYSGTMIHFNQRATEIVGLGKIDGGPSRWSSRYGFFLENEDGERLCPTEELPLVQAIRGRHVNLMSLIVNNDHKPQPVRIAVTASPIHDERGLPVGGLMVFHQIQRERRCNHRFRNPNTAISVGDSPVEVLDESFGGAGILIDSQLDLHVGQDLEIRYRGDRMRVVVVSVTPHPRGRRLGLEWKFHRDGLV